jgi:signal transduction histidine kinase
VWTDEHGVGGLAPVTPQQERARLALLVHEVRSPVAALLAIARTVAEPELDAMSRRELVRLTLAAASALERIVLDASLVSLQIEDVDVAQLVERVRAMFALDGHEVRTAVEHDLPSVPADPVRLGQALGNLVRNALVHAPAGTPTVSATAHPGEVRISVADEGAGIGIADQERIFEPGTRLVSVVPGSGLGLYVVRAVAQAHGGGARVASTPGAGSVFTIALPLT